MATVWVDQSVADDSGDGLSWGARKKTLSAANTVLNAQAKNSILNIVASGVYSMPTADLDIAGNPGTSFTDFGYLIRGVSGESETPAYVTLLADGADAIHRGWRMQTTSAYCIWRNILFDCTDKAADTNIYTTWRWNSAAGPIWLDGCAVLWGDSGVTAQGTRTFLNIQSSASQLGGTRIWDCYIQNSPSVYHNLTGGTLALSEIGNLFYNDIGGSTGAIHSRTLSAGTGADWDFYSNTLYYSAANLVVSTPLSYSLAGTSAGQNNVHSNLVYIESAHASPNIELLADSGSILPYTGTIGYNVLQGGPTVSSGDLNADGWYVGDSFDDGTDPKATDQAAYGVAEATLFNAPASTYAWDALGNGATITLPKDLRPRLYLTASLAGDVPGALPAAETDYSVVVTTDSTSPDPGDTVTLTVTYGNTGTNATSCVAAAAIPAGLSLVSAVASLGSYAAGVWTIGSVATGADETLVITVTVDADQAGNDIVFTASHTSADPANDTDASNDSDSVTLNVLAPSSGEDPLVTPFLDVAPIFAPVLLAEINAIMRTKRNRLTQHEQRSDVERHKWRECQSQRITLAAAGTTTIVSAIERIAHTLIEADGPIQVSASNGDTDHYFPDAQRIALLNGRLTTLKLRNNGATAVNVLLVVID